MGKNKGMMEYAKMNSVSIDARILVINSTKIDLGFLDNSQIQPIQELLMKIITKEKERKREETKTEITTINISQTSFKPDVWKKIDLTIKNNGTATAKEINVEFPKERVEIEGLKTIEELKPDEEKKLNITFRPIHAGEVPLKIEIGFKDLDNNEYKEEKTFWITVGDIIEKEEKQPASIEIKRGY